MNNNKQRMVSMHIYYAASYAQIVGTLYIGCSKGFWLPATYLIPGCVGRGFKLGSESSSGSGSRGGACKSGNLEISEPGHLGIWKPTQSKNIKFSQSKYVLPKMSVRFGLVGTNIS